MSEDQKLKSKTAEREEEILKFWKENDIFNKSLALRQTQGNEFVFYDGPPFATGEPHYGHLLAGTIKDAIPRYKTMRGFRVDRKWGWDCHGLPVENLIEKELGLGNKKDIEQYGINKFNAAARASVLRYEETWKKFVPRSGRWVDMDNAYKTMDSNYTESVWWSFKTLFDKDLIYQGFKVMPYCPHCGTTLSNFEVNLGYKDVSDISVYVKFKLKAFPNAYFLAWTTTPWTLPGNTALAVGKDIEYVEVKIGEEIFVLAKERLSILNAEYEILATHKGSEMVGMEYEPIFDFYKKDETLKNKENVWKVYVGDFVTTEEGTGIVHIAPAFGNDDYELSLKEKLPFIQHVDVEGNMKTEVKGFEGLSVKPKSSDEKERIATDIEIIKYLQSTGAYFDKKKITHSYPHCWRCDTPLLNYASASWFVKVTDLREKMIKENENVSWVPKEIGENRFGKWLEGARDWAISRSRFWGAPLPVWQNEKGDRVVMGSVADLKKYSKKSGNKYFAMRHAEAENNAANIVSKDKNLHPLTEKGRAQAAETAESLKDKKIDIIYASPFLRTKETAEIIAEAIGLPKDKIVYEEKIGEIDFGDLHLQPFSEFIKFRTESMPNLEDRLPNGESYLDVKKRSGEFMYLVEKEHVGKNILIVSHGAFLESLAALVEGADAKRSEDLVQLLGAQLGAAHEYDFVPLPHNENYELDLHRPYIDDIELVDEEGNKLTRIKEVFDTWYDSGSMPFASVHYPFENKERVADFIAEGLDQTRGWFYTLLVLGTGLFGRSPYKNVMVNGIVLAEDGQKMSKKLKNYPDPYLAFDKYGADSVRYYLLSSPTMRAEDLAFSEKGLDEVHKKIFLRLENILSFYQMYVENSPMSDMGESKNVLDQWITARLNLTGKIITESLDKYELDKASRPILDFVDDFSTWYIRRSRDRFKSDDIEDKNAALAITRFVLIELAKYMAPFTPFFSEHLYQELKSDTDPESVHLCDWPKFGKIDDDVLKNMEEVRRLVTLGLEKRNAAGIKVRQPLSALIITTEEKLAEEYFALIKDEVNVKEVSVGDEISLDIIITPELKKEGDVREFIRGVQDLRKEKDLTPDQKIILLIETSEEGKAFVESAKAEISKPTNVSDFSFGSNSGKELKVDTLTFKLDVS